LLERRRAAPVALTVGAVSAITNRKNA
jgi:hypothetical protein